jgi:hypothetical protein
MSHVFKDVMLTSKRRATLCIFVSAATTLLTNILSRGPTNSLAASDLTLIEPLLNLLGTLAASSQNEEVLAMHRSCAELFERARIVAGSFQNIDAIGSASFQGGAGGSGYGAPRESVEDFLRRIESISGGYDVAFETNV